MEVPPSLVGSGVGAVPAAGGSDSDSGVATIPAAAAKEAGRDRDSGVTTIIPAAAAAEAEAGNKVAAAAVEEDHKVKPAAAAGGKKRKRTTVRVQQGYVDLVLRKYPFTPCPWEPEVMEKRVKRVPDPAAREKFRAVMTSAVARAKAKRGKDEAIVVKQDLAQGYAEEEVEFSDGEEVQDDMHGAAKDDMHR